MSHSYRECIIDVIGDIYTFIFIRQEILFFVFDGFVRLFAFSVDLIV